MYHSTTKNWSREQSELMIELLLLLSIFKIVKMGLERQLRS